ncbi:hypothetical protein SRHO_G00096690 [Serrasalmus rhombeus]
MRRIHLYVSKTQFVSKCAGSGFKVSHRSESDLTSTLNGIFMHFHPRDLRLNVVTLSTVVNVTKHGYHVRENGEHGAGGLDWTLHYPHYCHFLKLPHTTPCAPSFTRIPPTPP